MRIHELTVIEADALVAVLRAVRRRSAAGFTVPEQGVLVYPDDAGIGLQDLEALRARVLVESDRDEWRRPMVRISLWGAQALGLCDGHDGQVPLGDEMRLRILRGHLRWEALVYPGQVREWGDPPPRMSVRELVARLERGERPRWQDGAPDPGRRYVGD